MGKEILYSHPEETGMEKVLCTLWFPGPGEVWKGRMSGTSPKSTDLCPTLSSPLGRLPALRDGYIVHNDWIRSSLHEDSWLPAWHGNSSRMRTKRSSSQAHPVWSKQRPRCLLPPQHLAPWKIPELRLYSSGKVVRVPQEERKFSCVLLVGLLFHRPNRMGKS